MRRIWRWSYIVAFNLACWRTSITTNPIIIISAFSSIINSIPSSFFSNIRYIRISSPSALKSSRATSSISGYEAPIIASFGSFFLAISTFLSDWGISISSILSFNLTSTIAPITIIIISIVSLFAQTSLKISISSTTTWKPSIPKST